MKTFSERIINFNSNINFTGKLPSGITMMNPFKENKKIIPVSSGFYKKYYNDNNKRHIILGINPGRFGGGVTGIPFTDPKRLIEKCGMSFDGDLTHELSSVFIYEMIEAFGGVPEFYSKFYINSICPLGFTAKGKKGKEVNHNYYDSKELTQAVRQFIVESIKKQITFGIHTDVCFCFGKGKNEKFLREVNEEYKFFDEIVALEHPRYIMQYKTKLKQFYIEKYLNAFRMNWSTSVQND
ncbi:MAG: uracil-DNA glycosylase family protein [Ignavibacteria bacterium]